MNNLSQRQIPLSEGLTLQNYIESKNRPTILSRLKWTIPSGKLDTKNQQLINLICLNSYNRNANQTLIPNKSHQLLSALSALNQSVNSTALFPLDVIGIFL